MTNFQNTSVTVFMYEDGTVCDPFDYDAYICATFVPGGLIVDYRYVQHFTDLDGGILDAMVDLGICCITVDKPINNIDDLRNALDMTVEV